MRTLHVLYRVPKSQLSSKTGGKLLYIELWTDVCSTYLLHRIVCVVCLTNAGH